MRLRPLPLALLVLVGCAAEVPADTDPDEAIDLGPIGKGDGATERSFEQLDFVGFEPDDPGAQAGVDEIWSGNTFRNGFPTARIELVEGVAEWVRGEPTLADQFRDTGALPSPPSRPVAREGRAQPALGQSYFDREGAEFTNRNCFLCHAGVTHGSVIAGAPNAHLDQAASYTRVQSFLDKRTAIMAEIRTAERLGLAEPIEVRELEDFFTNVALTIGPTQQFARSRGENFGPYAVWSHLARLSDPANEGLAFLPEEERTWRDDLFYGLELPPVDANAWWLRRFRETSYWYGEDAEFIAAHFAFNFTTPHAEVNETHEEHVATIARVLDFVNQTTSPRFPRRLDAEQVQRGMRLFHGEERLEDGSRLACANCHGDYEKMGDDYATPGDWAVTYRDRFFDVGTDPAYANVLYELAPIAEYGNDMATYFAERDQAHLTPQSIVPERSGYLAPPLVGVWASAPYFHNGSVPTLHQVLDSSARPALWQMINNDPFAYNLDEVGLACRGGEAGEGWRSHPYACTGLPMSTEEYDDLGVELAEASSILPSRRRRIREARTDYRSVYPTHLYGRSNQGHTFGDAMSDRERYAVIEFLNAVSGEGVVPATE